MNTIQQDHLVKLQGDVNVFGPDQIKMIKNYFSLTGLNTTILKTLEKMRTNLENDELEKRYDDLRVDFNKYIEKRISFLKDPNTAHNIDPWMELSFSAKDETVRDKLRQMSQCLQDALFNCDMVIKHKLKEGVVSAKEDLEHLKAQLVESYLSILRKYVDGKNMQKLTEKLPSEIEALETAFEYQKFDQAKKIIKQIRNECKTNNSALKCINK